MSTDPEETVSREDIVRSCLVRLRDDREADPGELREYMALSGLEAFDELVRELEDWRRFFADWNTVLKEIENEH